jgi:hypothetical protein
METTILKNRQKNRAFLLVIGMVFLVSASLSFIFHATPREMIMKLSEFAKHHYFLTGFISLVVAFSSFQIYSYSAEGASYRTTISGSGVLLNSRKRRMKVLIQNLKRTILPNRDISDSVFTKKIELAGLSLANEEVLSNPKEILLRQGYIEVALNLGKRYNQKVIISFFDRKNELRRHTLAAIWQHENECVYIKSGEVISIIPVKCIYKVEI